MKAWSFIQLVLLSKKEKLMTVKKNRLLVKFFKEKDMLFYQQDKQSVCISSRIEVTEAFIDEDDNVFIQVLIVLPHKKLFVTFGLEVLSDKKQLTKLLRSKGTFINQRYVDALVEYLTISTNEKLSSPKKIVSKMGWHEGFFVTAERVFGTESSIQLKENALTPKSLFSQSGDIEDWKSIFCTAMQYSPIITMSVACVLMPLLPPNWNTPSIGIHLLGDSSIGKTTTLKVANSILGPDELMKSWNSTENALEQSAYRQNNTCLVLDELESARGQTQVAKAIYALINGQGKGRALGDNGLRWKINLLSTGEVSLANSDLMHNSELRNGQLVRFLELDAEVSEYGVFDAIPNDFESSSDYSDFLVASSENLYGSIGIEFLEKLTSVDAIESLREKFHKKLDEAKHELIQHATSKISHRAAVTFANLAATIELCLDIGLLHLPEGGGLQAAVRCFDVWKKGFGIEGLNREQTEAIGRIQGFIEQYGSSRFLTPEQELAGKIIDNCAGYKVVLDGKTYYYFNSSVFKNLCKNRVKKTCDALKLKSLLHKEDGRNQAELPSSFKIDDFVRFYAISEDILSI